MPLQATSGAASYDAFGGGVPVVPQYIEDVFSTFLYTGQGSTNSYVNGIDLAGKGGLVWIKARSGTYGTAFHGLFDTTRGTGKILSSNSTAAQSGNSGDLLSAFNSDGFTVNTTYLGGFNETTNASATNYVSWTFRKQPKFFDVVTFTLNGAGDATFSHSLGSVPGSVFIKSTGITENWYVYHRSLGQSKYLNLNLTGTGGTATNIFQPTSTDFTFGLGGTPGATYVAYLFAHNAGGFGLTGTDNVISCGSFTADNAGGGAYAGGATVNLGYEPQFVMLKEADSTDSDPNWIMVDTFRGYRAQETSGSDVGQQRLRANTSGAEANAGGCSWPTATGFSALQLTGGATYIYIAIRRGPMKVPTSGTSVFAPVTYAGNSAAQTITAGFRVDMELVGCRTGGQGWEQAFADRLRGNGLVLSSASTGSEQNWSANLTNEFQSNTGTNRTDAYLNFSSLTFVDWMFQRAPSFFDEVCYTGTGSAQNITHNLGAVPELMIVKIRNSAATANWGVYHQALGNTEWLKLNLTDAVATNVNMWNSTTPTSSVFSIGTAGTTNTSSGTYVAYLFATCAGVSKVGSYTGNGSTQTIDCGFGAGGARFVLIKRTDSTGDWYVYDTARGMTVLTDPYLRLNSTAAEVATLGSVTTVSTGFAVNASILAAINTNAASYIFLAIA